MKDQLGSTWMYWAKEGTIFPETVQFKHSPLKSYLRLHSRTDETLISAAGLHTYNQIDGIFIPEKLK